PSQREPGHVVLAALGDDEADQMVAAMALQATHLWPDTTLHLVHVIDVLPVAQAAVAAAPCEWSYPGIDDIRRQGHDYVERFVRSTGAALGSPVEGHLLFGGPVEGILSLASRLRANLLVVGARDVSRLTRFLIGSKADALVHKAPCAVLIARPPKYAAHVAPAGEICPDCLQAEADSGGATLRCPRHALAYGRTHGHIGAAEREAS
ncbi:MAG: universal stress protein, partial [Polyangiaceae bacterium]|nr:universal stress protein [Polyangiaceae bacterium]